MQMHGYAGDLMPAQLAYVALTSRLLARPMSLAFVAEAAAGKNATVDAARALVPPGAVYEFTAGSPRALLYTKEPFEHRVVLFTDADGLPHNPAAASAVRSLAEGNALRYAVTTLNRQTGQFTTQTVTKPGPTGLVTTSTRPLRPPLSTRLLQVAVAGDTDATRAVLVRQGQEAAGETPPPPDLSPFLAFQRWLTQAGNRRVIVPFGETLAAAMPSTFEVRTRRDFRQLLSAVQTIALLHQRQRDQRNGAILATFDDYRVARELLEVSFYFAAAEELTPAIQETVEAIGPNQRNVSETDLARKLELTRQAVWARLRTPLKKKWVLNEGAGRGGPARLRRRRALPDVPTALPGADEVEERFWGIPNPGTPGFWKFAARLAADWPDGILAAEAAAQAQRDPDTVRARLDVLVDAWHLDHDPTTDRYGLREWVREQLAWREENRKWQQESDDGEEPSPAGSGGEAGG